MNSKIEGSKSVAICEHLRRQIEIGNYSRGAMLPSERDLSEELGASYMTVRKAIGQLVKEKYLERVPRVGTFVCSKIREDKVFPQLGVVIPTWGAPENYDFLVYASEAAEQEGWLPKFFFAKSWEDRTILDSWQTCEALILVAPRSIKEMPESLLATFKSHEKPVVFIGSPAHHFGLDTVSGSMEMEIGIILEELAKAGHKKIALVDQQSLIGETPSYYSIWQQKIKDNLGEDAVDELSILVETPRFELPHQAIHDRLKAFGKDIKFTAIITRSTFIWGVISALSDLGIRVPEDVSIISNGDRQEIDFYRPRITHLSVPLRSHISKAMELINARKENPDMPVQYSLVSPKFINGETLKDITKE